MSVCTFVCVSRPQPSAASARPAHRKRPGRRTAPTSAACATIRVSGLSVSSSRAPRHAAASGPCASASGADARAPPASDAAAAPAVSAHSSATATPTTSSTPKPRTIGTGESSSTSIAAALAAAAVAIVGPPAAAAPPISVTALGEDAPRASSDPASARRSTCSSMRAWNWIA